MSIPPIPNAEGVVDLGEIKQRADERDKLAAAAAEEQAKNALLAQIVSKDRAMTRAFKGILTTPERRVMQARAYARLQAEAEAAE